MTTLLSVGLGVMLVGQLWCAKVAFGRSVPLGVAVLLVPFASLVLAVKYWEDARGALALNVVGLVVAGGGAISLAINKGAVAAEVKAASAPAQPARPAETALSPETKKRRAAVMENCRDTTPAEGVCECIFDRLLDHYPGGELDGLLKDHEESGRWHAGYEDFVHVSETVCAANAAPSGSPGGPSAPVGNAAGETGPTTSPYEWMSASFDGKAVLRQKLSTARTCAISCTSGDKEVWKATVDCIATGRDFRFVSVDCERVVVVHNVRVDGTNWKAVTAATVYKRSKKAWDVGAVTVVKDQRRVAASPTWLQGVLGGAGEPPRYSKDGSTVEIDAVDGKHSQIPLVVAADAQAPEEEKSPSPMPKKKKRKK